LLEILGRLKAITERAEASTNPADAAALSQELREVSFEMTQRSYDRRSSYEEFAPLQLAWESTREAIATLRAGHALQLSDATDKGAARWAREEVLRSAGIRSRRPMSYPHRSVGDEGNLEAIDPAHSAS
jgi:hypothetical protein